MEFGLVKEIIKKASQRGTEFAKPFDITHEMVAEIVKYNGVQHSLEVAQEECAELIVEISHKKREDRNDETNTKIYEEVADVYNILDYLIEIYQLNPHVINSIRRTKINRALGKPDPIMGDMFVKKEEKKYEELKPVETDFYIAIASEDLDCRHVLNFFLMKRIDSTAQTITVDEFQIHFVSSTSNMTKLRNVVEDIKYIAKSGCEDPAKIFNYIKDKYKGIIDVDYIFKDNEIIFEKCDTPVLIPEGQKLKSVSKETVEILNDLATTSDTRKKVESDFYINMEIGLESTVDKKYKAICYDAITLSLVPKHLDEIDNRIVDKFDIDVVSLRSNKDKSKEFIEDIKKMINDPYIDPIKLFYYIKMHYQGYHDIDLNYTKPYYHPIEDDLYNYINMENEYTRLTCNYSIKNLKDDSIDFVINIGLVKRYGSITVCNYYRNFLISLRDDEGKKEFTQIQQNICYLNTFIAEGKYNPVLLYQFITEAKGYGEDYGLRSGSVDKLFTNGRVI